MYNITSGWEGGGGVTGAWRGRTGEKSVRPSVWLAPFPPGSSVAPHAALMDKELPPDFFLKTISEERRKIYKEKKLIPTTFPLPWEQSDER